jgi:hypothetical protein
MLRSIYYKVALFLYLLVNKEKFSDKSQLSFLQSPLRGYFIIGRLAICKQINISGATFIRVVQERASAVDNCMNYVGCAAPFF